MEIDQLAEAVEAHWALAAAGLSDLIWGHAALRGADGDGVLMKAAGWGFEEIEPDRIVNVSWNGELLDGPGPVHIEVPIHTEIMRARPDVGCVVHLHAPAVAAFAALATPLLPLSHDAVVFADEGLPTFGVTGSLIASRELGAALAAELGAAAAILMPKHGMVTVGAGAADAVMHAMLLERACRTQLMSSAAGEPRVWSDRAEVVEKRGTVASAGQLAAGYRYLVRRGAAIRAAERGL